MYNPSTTSIGPRNEHAPRRFNAKAIGIFFRYGTHGPTESAQSIQLLYNTLCSRSALAHLLTYMPRTVLHKMLASTDSYICR